MKPARTLAWIVAIALAAGAPQSRAQDPPATDETLTPEMEKQIERQRIEAEVAGLPRVTVDEVEQAVKFIIEDDLLAASTSLTPLQGEVRVVHPALAGVVRLRVHDLQAIGDLSSGRNFSYVQQDLTKPGTLMVYTHVNALAGRLNLARDAQSDEMHSQVELIQDPPGTPPEPDVHPVRLLVRITYEREDDNRHDDNRQDDHAGAEQQGENPEAQDAPPAAPAMNLPEDVKLSLGAPTFTELRQRYPREVEMYLRPILRDFQQDHIIFAVDERVAWQVLGGENAPDPQVAQKVEAVLAKFDSDDFRQREAALGELKQLGQPAVMVLAGADRSGFSPEQNAGVDEFLAEYLALDDQDVARLRASPDFLLDTLASDNPTLRKLALAQLREVTHQDLNFDPDAPPETRAKQVQHLRSTLTDTPATAPAAPDAKR